MGKKHIPFWIVTAMNINVMLGGGLFVNPSSLTRLAGPFGPFSYLAVALIMLPLVLVVAELSKIYPAEEGGLFVYSKYGIGSWAGIISGMSYFLAKATSTAVLSRVFVIYLQNIFPALSAYSPKLFIAITLVTIGVLNLIGMRVGSKVQLVFVFLKMIPVIAVILMIGFAFDMTNFTNAMSFPLRDITSTLPIALYAMMGFETCCSIAHTLEKGKSQIYKVVITSFLAVAVICTLFQLSLFGGLGQSLVSVSTPLGAFFAKVSKSFPVFSFVGEALLNSFVMVSIIGSCYGILQANNWNAFAVAREAGAGSVASKFTALNRYGMPTWCVMFQVCLSLVFALSALSIVSIQRTVVFGVVIAYFLTVFALLRSYRTENVGLPKLVTILSLFPCLYVAYNCIKDLL